jgi:hypothetical protein
MVSLENLLCYVSFSWLGESDGMCVVQIELITIFIASKIWGRSGNRKRGFISCSSCCACAQFVFGPAYAMPPRRENRGEVGLDVQFQ